MKWNAATIAAVATAVSVIFGGAELRIKVGEIDSRLGRVERTVDNLERTVGSTARYEEP